ncbi:MAG: hypothetical protein KBD01_04975 [Acidobacteria bacterium]|nr:hypothetical protein [Acidobacteriota bacterium]
MRRGSAFVLAALCLLAGAARPAGDALDEALALVGMRRADLGWEAKGWWPRFPDVPFKLRAFDSLFSEPLDNIAYVRALAATARHDLDPAQLDVREGNNGPPLFQAVQRLGVDPKFGGFRGYTANTLAPDTPLDEAILKLTELEHRPNVINTFGMELPYPRPRQALADEAKKLPPGVSPILGRLVLNVADAHRWAELAFRKVDGRDRAAVATRLNIGDEMIDAWDYLPAIDDVARTLDEASLWYAGQKCVQALDEARTALQKLQLGAVAPFAFDWQSPLGWIRVRGGGNDAVDGEGALLIVDLGGEDTYRGGVAASTATRPIGLLLDLAGNDSYVAEVPAQGAGMAGVGILLDVAGNDTYKANRYAQGVGQFGMGVLADLGGDDVYFDRFSGQGCGYFGIGLLLDLAGTDAYTLHGDGQGLGGVAGVGVLADRSGNDRYTAVREHSVTGRPSYHSPELDVAVSNAQGVGAGRRGDGADGHSWAGGLGALLDGAGDDVYTAGNWSMGTGYWFGIGVLHDGAGNDEYHGVTWSQGTGAHFCIGTLVDEGGNDKHLAEANSTLSLAWAHDFTVGILADMGGDDEYSVNSNGLGGSINRSVALLIEGGGNDVYRTKDIPRPGFAKNDEKFRARDGVSTYFADTSSIGLFLDAGGRDTYWGDIRNNSRLLDPKDSPNWADRNFSVFVDREGGRIDLTPLPVRLPSLSGPAQPARP